MVVEIEEPERKKEIAERILYALPDWFGMPEHTNRYIEESAAMPFWAWLEGDVPVGFLALKETSRHTAEIFVMGVLPEYHRRGVGRKLAGELESFAARFGYSYLQVKTVQSGRYEEYDRTNEFYRAVGFCELECFPGLWDEWNPCQIYVKYIGR